MWLEARRRGVRITIRVGAPKPADGHDMGNHASKSFAGKPGMEMERRRLDPEHFRPARFELEGHGLLAGWADARADAREHGLRGAVDMPGGNQQCARVALENYRQSIGVTQPHRIRVDDAGIEWRV